MLVTPAPPSEKYSFQVHILSVQGTMYVQSVGVGEGESPIEFCRLPDWCRWAQSGKAIVFAVIKKADTQEVSVFSNRPGIPERLRADGTYNQHTFFPYEEGFLWRDDSWQSPSAEGSRIALDTGATALIQTVLCQLQTETPLPLAA